MNLYVVGEEDPDPKTWSVWSECAIVVAGNEDEARALAERPDTVATEIPLTIPQVLVWMREPNWGRDL